ncbi:MAG: acyl-CoA dehydrogenase family protein [Polyangiales bacterium]
MADASSTWLGVLAGDPVHDTAFSNLQALWAAYGRQRTLGCSPFSAAVRVASRADRLGHAFAVGYPAALEHMVGEIEVPCALCVTESGGNSPRSIAATLEPLERGYRLNGEKTFVTFGTLAKTLIIACRAGDKPDGRPDLTVVRIPASREGIVLIELPTTPFAPEVPHARVELDGVAVASDERLPGDGYLGYVKPFRTIEDIHVMGAALGYVVGLAMRLGSSAELVAELSAALGALDAIRQRPPLDPRVHVVLHGVLQQVKSALQSDRFDRLLEAAPDAERDRWLRDRALLDIASKARAARFERAQNELW